MNANIAALLTAVLTALTWAITIDLILIRRFKNRGSILKYNFWTAFLMGTNLLICLPTLAFFNHQSLSWLVRQAWLLAVVTDILTTGALIIFILVTWIMRLIPVPSCFDFLIVLGAALNKGKVPPVLAARLDWAVELWKTNPEAVIIVTGGVAHGDQVAEAVAMGQHLQR
ncbi:MAG TPA: YdcF family protein, partial [Candidatus Limosilactobacillus intestinipullorum]|nr:YdcF family protein [Candidatus Limosilactobacillus intestinipullorum]